MKNQDDGQVLVRASGTEPLIRMRAQGPNQVELDNITEAHCGSGTERAGKEKETLLRQRLFLSAVNGR